MPNNASMVSLVMKETTVKHCWIVKMSGFPPKPFEGKWIDYKSID